MRTVTEEETIRIQSSFSSVRNFVRSEWLNEQIAEEHQRYITCMAHDLTNPLLVFKQVAGSFSRFFEARNTRR